jgi:hypothetical protein
MGNRASRRLEARLDEMDKRIELIERRSLHSAFAPAKTPAKTLRDALEDAWGKPITSTLDTIDALGALIAANELAQHEEGLRGITFDEEFDRPPCAVPARYKMSWPPRSMELDD